MKAAVLTTLLPFTVFCACAVAAEPVEMRDAQGRVILQSDGADKAVHTYAPDGRRVRTQTSQDKRIDFDQREPRDANREKAPLSPPKGG